MPARRASSAQSAPPAVSGDSPRSSEVSRKSTTACRSNRSPRTGATASRRCARPRTCRDPSGRDRATGMPDRRNASPTRSATSPLGATTAISWKRTCAAASRHSRAASRTSALSLTADTMPTEPSSATGVAGEPSAKTRSSRTSMARKEPTSGAAVALPACDDPAGVRPASSRRTASAVLHSAPLDGVGTNASRRPVWASDSTKPHLHAVQVREPYNRNVPCSPDRPVARS